jgi:coenzyme F420-reducing hydrogenase delta subunit
MLDRSGTGSPLPDRKRCSGAVQANFFLDFVNPGPDTLVVLGYRTDPGAARHRKHTAPGIETGKRDKFNSHLNGLKKLRA